jgi:hypothetical protein
MTVKAALEAICKVGGVCLIEAINFTATFYGRTFDSKGHVCFLVKAAADSQVLSIDVKASSESLADSLLSVLTKNLQ